MPVDPAAAMSPAMITLSDTTDDGAAASAAGSIRTSAISRAASDNAANPRLIPINQRSRRRLRGRRAGRTASPVVFGSRMLPPLSIRAGRTGRRQAQGPIFLTAPAVEFAEELIVLEADALDGDDHALQTDDHDVAEH